VRLVMPAVRPSFARPVVPPSVRSLLTPLLSCSFEVAAPELATVDATRAGAGIAGGRVDRREQVADGGGALGVESHVAGGVGGALGRGHRGRVEGDVLCR